MKRKLFKKYKINQLQYIKQSFKYIYLFRYNDLKLNEINIIKKKLKNLNYDSLILKQKLSNNFFFNIEGQGTLLIIFGNTKIDLIKDLSNFKKLDFIYLTIEKNIYSNLKLKKITSSLNNPLNFTLIKPFLNFLYYLRESKKANIT